MLNDIKPVTSPQPQTPTPPVQMTGTGFANGSSFATTSEAAAAGAAKSKFQWFKKHKKLVIIGALVLVLVIGGTVAAVVMRKKPAPKPVVTQKAIQKAPPPPPPPPVILYSPLTGAPVSAEDLKRPVTAIMIENSPDARPQSGMLDAGVVFEAIAEGGITRFLTLFQEGKPGYIGPIRSVRPYYIDWLLPFDAAVAHVGGSRDALDMLKTLKAKDLDQFANAAPYHRIPQRYAPHNVYSSMAELDALSTSKGYISSTFTSWPRKPDELSKAPTASQIDLAISGPFYNAHYDYEPATGKYQRSEGGQPHIDEKTGYQLAPRVVVAMVVPYRNIQAIDGYREQYDTVGDGIAFLFQDGIVQQIKWNKASQAAQLLFTNDAGIPIKFNIGQTWITAIGAASEVTYK